MHVCRASWYTDLDQTIMRQPIGSRLLRAMAVIDAYWTKELIVFQSSVPQALRAKFVVLLKQNEFCDVGSLRHAEHPSRWLGAGDLSENELQTLSRLCR